MKKLYNFSFYHLRTLRFLLILFVGLMLFSISSSAQIDIPILNEATDELVLEKANNTINSEVQLFQRGNYNQAQINQSRIFQYDLPNQAILIQNGFQNILKINQISSNGEIVATQNGVNNNLDLSVDGKNLRLSTFQDGNDNKIKQKITNSSNMDMNLIQKGDNNSIDQTLNNLNSIGMTIIQKGQNATIKVIHH